MYIISASFGIKIIEKIKNVAAIKHLCFLFFVINYLEMNFRFTYKFLSFINYNGYV